MMEKEREGAGARAEARRVLAGAGAGAGAGTARGREKTNKTTHVFHHDKYLKNIPKMKNPTHAIYAYFHNNELTKIENLDLMYNLTHLHLQWNKIAKIEGLEKLYKLKKLYLGNNCISVVENLEGLKYLEELHIEKQNISNADGLCFDPRTLSDIGANLRILDVSNNKINHISWIKPLRRLEILIAKNNKLENHDEVANSLCTLGSLVNIDFTGNPMTKKHRYKEIMVARCCQLRVLDGTTISNISRTFMQEFDKACRLQQLNAKNLHPVNTEGMEDFFDLNMITGLKSQSALALRSPAKKSRAQIVATDSSYNFVPKLFRRNKTTPNQAKQPLPEKPPDETIPLLMLSEQSGITQYIEEPKMEPPKPRKGILKKPMPMKYI